MMILAICIAGTASAANLVVHESAVRLVNNVTVSDPDSTPTSQGITLDLKESGVIPTTTSQNAVQLQDVPGTIVNAVLDLIPGHTSQPAVATTLSPSTLTPQYAIGTSSVPAGATGSSAIWSCKLQNFAQETSLGTVDVSQYTEIRVFVYNNPGPYSSNAYISLEEPSGGQPFAYTLDTFTVAPGYTVTKIYDVPGDSIQILANPGFGNRNAPPSDSVAVEIFGK